MLTRDCLNKRSALLVIFWLLLAGVVSVAYSTEDLDKSRQQLADIEQRLEQTLADLAHKKTVESDVLTDLKLVDRQLSKLKQRVALEKQRLNKLKKSISVEKIELSNSKKEVSRLQIKVQQRLVAMYKSEETGVLKTLFSAQSISQLLEDYDYLGRVVKHDKELLSEFRQRVESRQASLNRMATAKQQQLSVTNRLKSEEEALKRTLRLKKRYLAAVRKDRTALDKMAADLKQRTERLTDLVTELEQGGSGSQTLTESLFALQKGLLPWPVNGRIKTAFGSYRHPELGTLLENHGVEIVATASIGVKSVWDGRVVFAKRFKGYGNLMIIDHDGGYYTLYAQVQNMQKKNNDRVQKGDLIAYSGFEGAEHVYFEVRKGRTPIDPLLWIEKR